MFQMFLDLLDSDRRVCEAVACCLCRLTVALLVRVRYHSDPGIANLKQAVSVAVLLGICMHCGTLCLPVPSHRGTNLTSFTHFSPHLPRYVLAKFNFHL
jgi:hypothetical protein